MMVQQNSNNWLRKFEVLSLIINIIGWPVICFSLSFLSLYYWVPISNNPNLIYMLILLFLFLGIIVDSRFGPVGIYFVRPLKNYIKHSESQYDKNNALISIFGTLFIVTLFYGLLQIILSL